MLYFPAFGFQYFILAFLIGLAVLIILYLAIRARAEGGPIPPEGEAVDLEDLDRILPRKKPVPTVLIFVILGFILWAVGYVILVGILGGPV
jgi:hypothetical protein